MDNNEIARRIKKLLALSQSHNHHEAAQALKMAHKLIEKYKLSHQDLLSCNIKTLSIKSVRGLKFPLCTKALAYIISTLSNTVAILEHENTVFIGYSEDLENIEYLQTFLTESLLNLRKEYLESLKQNNFEYLKKDPVLERLHYLNLITFSKTQKQVLLKKERSRLSYLKKRNLEICIFGFLQGIASALNDIEHTKDPKILEYVDKLYPNIRRSRQRTISLDASENQAYLKGVNKGHNASIKKALYKGHEKAGLTFAGFKSN